MHLVATKRKLVKTEKSEMLKKLKKKLFDGGGQHKLLFFVNLSAAMGMTLKVNENTVIWQQLSLNLTPMRRNMFLHQYAGLIIKFLFATLTAFAALIKGASRHGGTMILSAGNRYCSYCNNQHSIKTVLKLITTMKSYRQNQNQIRLFSQLIRPLPTKKMNFERET